mmetsp:Transcript_17030/g.42553  ORF Transcript_17030/g.42553 Transcript_17030/m.42553 type:complete len:216 (-) Transcript_17030:228-875(-)
MISFALAFSAPLARGLALAVVLFPALGVVDLSLFGRHVGISLTIFLSTGRQLLFVGVRGPLLLVGRRGLLFDALFAIALASLFVLFVVSVHEISIGGIGNVHRFALGGSRSNRRDSGGGIATSGLPVCSQGCIDCQLNITDGKDGSGSSFGNHSRCVDIGRHFRMVDSVSNSILPICLGSIKRNSFVSRFCRCICIFRFGHFIIGWVCRRHLLII